MVDTLLLHEVAPQGLGVDVGAARCGLAVVVNELHLYHRLVKIVRRPEAVELEKLCGVQPGVDGPGSFGRIGSVALERYVLERDTVHRREQTAVYLGHKLLYIGLYLARCQEGPGVAAVRAPRQGIGYEIVAVVDQEGVKRCRRIGEAPEVGGGKGKGDIEAVAPLDLLHGESRGGGRGGRGGKCRCLWRRCGGRASAGSLGGAVGGGGHAGVVVGRYHHDTLAGQYRYLKSIGILDIGKLPFEAHHTAASCRVEKSYGVACLHLLAESMSSSRAFTAASSCWSIPLATVTASLATLMSGSSCWFSR